MVNVVFISSSVLFNFNLSEIFSIYSFSHRMLGSTVFNFWYFRITFNIKWFLTGFFFVKNDELNFWITACSHLKNLLQNTTMCRYSTTARIITYCDNKLLQSTTSVIISIHDVIAFNDGSVTIHEKCYCILQPYLI